MARSPGILGVSMVATATVRSVWEFNDRIVVRALDSRAAENINRTYHLRRHVNTGGRRR